MIDSEPAIFNHLSKRVRAVYGDQFKIYSQYVESSAEFPAAIAMEIDNVVYEKMRTDKIENAQKVTWEINVFSNLIGGGKFEAREIMLVFDSAFEEIGFTRTMMTPAPNFQNSKIYRLIARYYGVVDKELRIYTQ